MDEVSCSLGVEVTPPKKIGDSSSFYRTRSKVFSVASAEPPSLLITNCTWLQGGNAAYFPYVEFTLWACVCIKTQCKQKGLLGKTLAVLN